MPPFSFWNPMMYSGYSFNGYQQPLQTTSSTSSTSSVPSNTAPFFEMNQPLGAPSIAQPYPPQPSPCPVSNPGIYQMFQMMMSLMMQCMMGGSQQNNNNGNNGSNGNGNQPPAPNGHQTKFFHQFLNNALNNFDTQKTGVLTQAEAQQELGKLYSQAENQHNNPFLQAEIQAGQTLISNWGAFDIAGNPQTGANPGELIALNPGITNAKIDWVAEQDGNPNNISYVDLVDARRSPIQEQPLAAGATPATTVQVQGATVPATT